jgi:hypothetical protein
MKRLFTLTAILLTFTYLLEAQGYNFPTSKAKWETTHYSACIGGSSIYFSWWDYLGADTVMQGVTYQRLMVLPRCKRITAGTHCDASETPYYGVGIPSGGIRREGQKVYFRKFNIPGGTPWEFAEDALANIPAETEILLYDFNWQIGDTVTATVSSGTPYRYVVSDTSTQNGRKNITLKHLSLIGYTTSVIEGIGHPSGLFGLYYSPVSGIHLPGKVCFYQNNVLILDGEHCNVCSALPTDVDEFTKSVDYTLSPNPADQTVAVTMPADFNGTVKWQLADVTGRVVSAGSSSSTTFDIDVARLPTGSYFLFFPTQQIAPKRLAILH